MKLLKGKEWKSWKRSSIMLLKQLRVAAPIISSKSRERALKVAKEWKERMEANHKNTLGVLGFFNFLAAYGLVSDFSIDELVNFSAMYGGIAENDDFPELCWTTGLADRVPDIVQKLMQRGKHIVAVKYVYAFNLVDKIPPVSILKACVYESKELSKSLSEEGKPLMEITAREIHTLKSAIKIIENHKLESEYPRASLEQRIEELRRQKKSFINSHAPASATKTPQQPHQQPQQLSKRKMQKLKKQQGGTQHPRTSAPVGPEAALKNVNSDNSRIHQYQEYHLHSSGIFSEHPNPYMSSPAMPFGMVPPTPAISPYAGPSVGPYDRVGVPMNPSANPSLGGSHPNSSELHVPSDYYGETYTYDGVVGLQHYYKGSY